MNSVAIWRRTALLAIAGGAAFGLANFLISVTPIAADYRAALSIAYAPMLVAAMVGGLVIGLGVSYFLLRFYDRIPTSNSLGKAMVLSLIALVLATLLLDVPARFLTASSDSLRLFLIGLAFNGVRILALGLVIGYLNDRVDARMGIWRQTHERE